MRIGKWGQKFNQKRKKDKPSHSPHESVCLDVSDLKRRFSALPVNDNESYKRPKLYSDLSRVYEESEEEIEEINTHGVMTDEQILRRYISEFDKGEDTLELQNKMINVLESVLPQKEEWFSSHPPRWLQSVEDKSRAIVLYVKPREYLPVPSRLQIDGVRLDGMTLDEQSYSFANLFEIDDDFLEPRVVEVTNEDEVEEMELI